MPALVKLIAPWAAERRPSITPLLALLTVVCADVVLEKA